MLSHESFPFQNIPKLKPAGALPLDPIGELTEILQVQAPYGLALRSIM